MRENHAGRSLCSLSLPTRWPEFCLPTVCAGSVLAIDIGQLLNRVNAMNYDEIQIAKSARAKAGDNQSLPTYAETLKGDHEANKETVEALSFQKKVRLESVPSEVDQKRRSFENRAQAKRRAQ